MMVIDDLGVWNILIETKYIIIYIVLRHGNKNYHVAFLAP